MPRCGNRPVCFAGEWIAMSKPSLRYFDGSSPGGRWEATDEKTTRTKVKVVFSCSDVVMNPSASRPRSLIQIT